MPRWEAFPQDRQAPRALAGSSLQRGRLYDHCGASEERHVRTTHPTLFIVEIQDLYDFTGAARNLQPTTPLRRRIQ